MANNVEFKVERFKKIYTERERGYLPVRRVQELQRLVRIKRGWFGLKFRKTLDVEEIPAHVLITLGCCGDTGGWLSKFAPYISAQNLAAQSRA